MLGNLYTLANGTTAKKNKFILALEALERDLDRGKPLFRRKRGKVRNLDVSGQKGLADWGDGRPPPSTGGLVGR